MSSSNQTFFPSLVNCNFFTLIFIFIHVENKSICIPRRRQNSACIMYSSVTWVIFCFNCIITSCTFFSALFVCICDAVLFSRPGKCGRCLTNFVAFMLVFVSVSVKIQPKPGKTSSTGSQMSYQNIGKVIPYQLFLPNNLFSLHLKTKRKVLVASNNLYISCGV